MTADEKLRQAILKILAKSKFKLFGCLIYKFDLQIINESKIDGDHSPKTAYCFINPINKKPSIHFYREFIDSSISNVHQMIWVILHEMIHFIDGHLSKFRIEGRDQHMYNLAADHDINTKLDEDIKGVLKGELEAWSGKFVIDELIDKDYSLIEVYEWLMDKKSKIVLKFRKSSEGKDKADENRVDGDVADVYIDGKYKGSVNLDLTADSSGDGEAVADELKSEIRSIINNLLNKHTSKGIGKGKIYEYLEKISALEVPWNILLENAIQTTMIKSNTNKSWKNIRKKYRHIGVTLPDTSKDLIMDNLYIVLDTSGSMSTLELEKFMDLIIQSINYFKTIKIIQHDYGIQNILDLTRDNFEMEKENIFSIYGRGGTSHDDCFKYIEDQFFNEDEKIGLVILCTDYGSDIEQIWNNFEFHKFIPVKVLCTQKGANINPDVDSKAIYC